VLKHGLARIELVRVVCCFNKKEANRAEGLFIRELPTCVNICKNYANRAEYRKANKDIILAKAKVYHQENKDIILARKKERYDENRDTLIAHKKEKVTCECGAVVNRSGMSLHRNAWKHFNDFIHL
jgi:hypothetical protein